jgi:hypothetical protein
MFRLIGFVYLDFPLVQLYRPADASRIDVFFGSNRGSNAVRLGLSTAYLASQRVSKWLIIDKREFSRRQSF